MIMILFAQIIVSILLIGIVLMQAKGTGMTEWGGGTSAHSRRGFEKVLFQSTIGLVVIFILISVLPLFGI